MWTVVTPNPLAVSVLGTVGTQQSQKMMKMPCWVKFGTSIRGTGGSDALSAAKLPETDSDRGGHAKEEILLARAAAVLEDHLLTRAEASSRTTPAASGLATPRIRTETS